MKKIILTVALLLLISGGIYFGYSSIRLPVKGTGITGVVVQSDKGDWGLEWENTSWFGRKKIIDRFDSDLPVSLQKVGTRVGCLYSVEDVISPGGWGTVISGYGCKSIATTSETEKMLTYKNTFGLKGQNPTAILDGLEINSQSQLVWGNYPILTREKMLEAVYGEDKDFNLKDYEETGFTEINKYVRDNKIYMYFAAGQGCGGCFSPVSTYLVIDPTDGSIAYEKLDRTKNPFLFQRIPEIIISPDKSKGAYVSNDPGGLNNPNEPEVVWVIDFATGVSTIYKKLPLGQTMYEIGGTVYSGGRFKWNEDSDTLIIKTIKREL